MVKRISILKAFIHTYILGNVARSFVLLSGVIIARSLGPDGRGDVAMVMATISILSVLGSIVNGANEILLGEDYRRQKLLIRQSILWSGLLLLVIIIIISNVPERTLIYFLGSSNNNLYYLFPFLFFVFVTEEGIRRILLAKQDFKYINRVQTSSVFLYLVLIVLLR